MRLGNGLSLAYKHGSGNRPPNRFGIAVTPSTRSIAQGETATFTITLTQRAGTPEYAILGVTGLPPNTTSSIEYPTLTGTVETFDTTTVLGTGTSFTTDLYVGAPVFLAGPGTTLEVATIVSDTELTLTSSAVASGASTIKRQSILTDGGTTTFTVSAASDAPPATLDSVLVSAVATSQTRRKLVYVTVELNDFTVAVTNDGDSIAQGANATFTITLTKTSGNAQTTSAIVVSGLPSGVTAGVADETISTDGGTTTCTLTAGPSATIGAGSFTVTVTAPDATRTGTGSVTITSGGSYTADSNSITSDSSLVTADAA